MKNIINILSVIILLFCNIIQAVEYSYDAIGRLTKVSYENETSISYTYDSAGNLTESTTSLGVEFHPVSLISPRSTVYQTETLKIDLFEDGDGYNFNDSATVYSHFIDLSDGSGFALDPDYVNNGLLQFTPSANFSGVVTISYLILENGVVYTVERHIVVREFDSDGDGIPDAWEEAGSINGVSLAGAEVGTKDVFLWIDHMYQECSLYERCKDVDYKLNEQLKPIQEAFARQNINLHIKEVEEKPAAEAVI